MTPSAWPGTAGPPASWAVSLIAIVALTAGCSQTDPAPHDGPAAANTPAAGPAAGVSSRTDAGSGGTRNVVSPGLASVDVGDCLTWYGTPGAAPVQTRCANLEANWRVVRLTGTTYNRAGEQCFTQVAGPRARFVCVRRLFKEGQCQEVTGAHLFPFATVPCDWSGSLNAGTHIGRITRTVSGRRITCPNGQTPFDFASGDWRRVGKSVCVQPISPSGTSASMAAG